MGKQLRQRGFHASSRTSLGTCFSRFLVAGSLIAALGGCCKGDHAPRYPRAVLVSSDHSFRNSKKSLEILSRQSMADEGKLETAARELERMGLEFRRILQDKGPKAAASSYLSFLPSIRAFNKRIVERFDFPHVLALVNDVGYMASGKSGMTVDLRLGCLMLVLPELPHIVINLKKDNPKENGIMGKNTFFRINLSAFWAVFSDDSSIPLKGTLLLWADSKDRYSLETMSGLLRSIRHAISKD